MARMVGSIVFTVGSCNIGVQRSGCVFSVIVACSVQTSWESDRGKHCEAGHHGAMFGLVPGGV